MTYRVAHLLALVSALVMTGCAALRPIAASSDEWLAYRKTRVSPTIEGRVVAASRYLARYPSGAFVTQTKEFFDIAEPLYFEEQRNAPDGLYTYLAALPRGPHADEAKQLLYRRLQKPRGPTGFDGRLMALGTQVGKIAAARAAARKETLEPLQMWLDPDAFVRPISEAKPQLVMWWSLSLPVARCRDIDEPSGGIVRECVKLLEPEYEVTSGEEQEARQATVEVSVSQDVFGRPRKAVVGGPDLFIRLEEMFGGRTIAPDDTNGRAIAVSHATEVVRREFATIVSSDAACRKRAKAPSILELRCNGIRVTMEAAIDAASDDRIVIEPDIDKQ